MNLTPKQIDYLKSAYVEQVVDNMSTKDLVQYVMDDLDRYYEKVSDVDFLDDAQNYWEEYFDELVQESKEGDIDLTDNDDTFIDINNTGGKY